VLNSDVITRHCLRFNIDILCSNSCFRLSHILLFTFDKVPPVSWYLATTNFLKLSSSISRRYKLHGAHVLKKNIHAFVAVGKHLAVGMIVGKVTAISNQNK